MCGNQGYEVIISRGYLDLQIAQLEMFNILVGLGGWGSQWVSTCIMISIACDNEPMLHILNSVKTRDITLAAIARNIQFDIYIF